MRRMLVDSHSIDEVYRNRGVSFRMCESVELTEPLLSLPKNLDDMTGRAC
jgi:hypothetical protein